MISFLVPAFNEVEHIGPTVETLRRVTKNLELDGHEIVLIDDGSVDGTSECLRELEERDDRITAVFHPRNLGLGAAIRSGLDVATCPCFMVVPGDNDVQEDLLEALIKCSEVADVVMSVPLNRELRSLLRNNISNLYQTIYQNAFRVFVNYINGPGIWPTEQARAMDLKSRRFSIISELNVKLLRSGCSYAEVPGYFQAGPKHRSTVNLKNLYEVGRTFLRLWVEVHVTRSAEFSSMPTRRSIGFSAQLGPSDPEPGG
jgi:glycosyltransferase involved in cell wall biosynthesis